MHLIFRKFWLNHARNMYVDLSISSKTAISTSQICVMCMYGKLMLIQTTIVCGSLHFLNHHELRNQRIIAAPGKICVDYTSLNTCTCMRNRAISMRIPAFLQTPQNRRSPGQICVDAVLGKLTRNHATSKRMSTFSNTANYAIHASLQPLAKYT